MWTSSVFFTRHHFSYILVKRYFSTKNAHNFIHTINLVVSTYQQSFPHCPQLKIILSTFLLIKSTTIYRIITSYTQFINILCISTPVRCFFITIPVDNFLKNLSIKLLPPLAFLYNFFNIQKEASLERGH